MTIFTPTLKNGETRRPSYKKWWPPRTSRKKNSLFFRDAGYNIDENLQVASSRVSFQDEVAQKVNASSTAFEQ